MHMRDRCTSLPGESFPSLRRGAGSIASMFLGLSRWHPGRVAKLLQKFGGSRTQEIGGRSDESPTSTAISSHCLLVSKLSI